MSNESPATETTPLRRPQSRNSEEDVSTTSTHSTSRDVVTNATGSANHKPAPSANSSAVVTIAKFNNNNNNTVVHLSQNANTTNSHHSNTNSNSNCYRQSTPPQTRMDNNKRVLYRIAVDIFLLACVGFPILIFFLVGEPYKRGFFCDDESLKHPFKESTVQNWMLYVIGLVIPVATILIVEFLQWRLNNRISNGNQTAHPYILFGYEIPEWMVECYKKIGIFGFGAAVSQLTTDIAKYSIGRLRPHFFTVCQPVMNDGTTCEHPDNLGRYIQDFRCVGQGSTARMLKEINLSFPSGHSSFTFYTMVYLAIYLQARMTWRGSKLMRHFIQFVLIMVAWFTALSRVSDYKHHWSDVLGGSLIGVVTAVVVANYVSDLFREKSSKSYYLPRTTQDMNTSAQTITTNGH